MNIKDHGAWFVVGALFALLFCLVVWTNNHRTRMPEVSGLSWNAAKGCYDPTDKDWAPALLHPDVTESHYE